MKYLFIDYNLIKYINLICFSSIIINKLLENNLGLSNIKINRLNSHL